MPTVPKLLQNGWLSGPDVPASCSVGNSPDFYETDTNILYTCISDVYVPVITLVSTNLPPIPFVVASAGFSGAGSTLTAGSTPGVSLVYCVPVPKACTVTSWTITVDTGTAGFRVWRVAAGTAVPTVANSITTADLAISSGTNLKSTTFTNFTGGMAPTFALGDLIAIQLNAVAGASYAAFSMVGQ